MQEVTLKNGKIKLCFMIKEGSKNDIVILIDSLAAIDYQRLSKIEAKGGEMMREMRDSTIKENGMNALSIYKDLLIVVPKVGKLKKTETVIVDSETNKRGPGRPKGAKNKKKDQ